MYNSIIYQTKIFRSSIDDDDDDVAGECVDDDIMLLDLIETFFE